MFFEFAGKLRVSVSEISTKAFACGKIRIQKEGEVPKGKKNIAQSLRYTLFGIQVQIEEFLAFFLPLIAEVFSYNFKV
mgnify:CR=1 FL=1